MIGIYSFPHGVMLNPREWALDEDSWAEYGIHFGEVEEQI